MPSIDELLASSPLAGLRRVSASGGDRKAALVRVAESFTDLDRSLKKFWRKPNARRLLKLHATKPKPTDPPPSADLWPDYVA